MFQIVKPVGIAFSSLILTACVAGQSIPNIDHYQRMGYPIVITNYGTTSPNSAGGIDFRAGFTNIASAPVKYIDLQVELFNQVGDEVPDRITGDTIRGVRFTGPLMPGKSTVNPLSGMPTQWENIWYNHSGYCATINNIKVSLMNGQTFEYAGGEVLELISGESGCKRAY